VTVKSKNVMFQGVSRKADVGSIPIARSTFRCFPLAFVLGEAFARFSVSKASMRPNSSHSLRNFEDEELDIGGGPPQRQGCVFVRQSTKYRGGRVKAVALQYYQS
jgi:hypothetical protein